MYGLLSAARSDGLYQRGFRTQETFLVRIQNGNQGYLRQVKTFTQQVDANQHIKQTKPQIP